jgi:hypothetical protein
LKIIKKSLILLIITIITIGFTACSKKPIENMVRGDKEKDFNTLITDDYNNLDINKIDKYNIEVEFFPEDKKYHAEQKTTYINKENVDLKNVYFHVYPNAFKKRETAPFLFDSFETAYPNGFEKGYIDIEEVKVNGNKINYKLIGKGDTILKLDLNKKLNKGKSIDISMKYTVKLPPAQDRFGYGDKTFNFGNWYPIAAVYDEDGWNLDPYYSVGDPFYSDVSNYNVKIKAPRDIVLATSGNIIEEKIKGDKKIWDIEAKLMRDFAWVASNHFEKITKNYDNTAINLYFLDGVSEVVKQRAIDFSKSSLKYFNNIFGKYPYGKLSVVQTSFPSGMEYPGIVYIGDNYYNEKKIGSLELVIVHEIAHQWWYGIVGNDEIDEAWLDESLATYSEYIYAYEEYGEDTANEYYKNGIENNYEMSKELIKDKNILKSLNEFVGWNDYGPLVYSRGAMMIHDINKQFGKEELYDILKTYYEEFKFKNATTEDFLRIVEDKTNSEFKNSKEYLNK